MARTKLRYQVAYQFRGHTRYGIVSSEKAKTKGNVIVADAVMPWSAEVPDSDTTDLPNRDDFPEYDRMTGKLLKGGNAFDKFVNQAFVDATNASKAAGKGVKVGKMFTIGVADGCAYYVITKIAAGKATVEWRGFQGDRYTDHFFGYGKTVKTADVAKYIHGDESVSSMFADIDKRDRAIIESQPTGTILHYISSGGNFPRATRFEVVELHGGEKAARFIGVVGKYPAWALPHRNAWGAECMDSDIEKWMKEPVVRKLSASRVYEYSKCEHMDFDPRGLPLVDLTMPEMTDEQAECRKLTATLQKVRDALNDRDEEYNSATCRRKLADVYKLLRAELAGWTCDDFANNGLKDNKLSD